MSSTHFSLGYVVYLARHVAEVVIVL